MNRPSARVLFLNQVTGRLFRELAEDIATSCGGGVLLTDAAMLPADFRHDWLLVQTARAYERSSTHRRLWSWGVYFVQALWAVFRSDRRTVVFIVSNPPFLALAGWLAAVLRRQRYVVLVYDVYPGLLENLGRLRKGGGVARLWRWVNRVTWGRARVVFTIGNHMAANVRAMLPSERHRPRLVVVPNWADGAFVRPLAKADNAFAGMHGQRDRLTVLYSGNVGMTHDLGTLFTAAEMLQEDQSIQFLLIGGGARWPAVKETMRQKRLQNVRMLPFQAEALLPLTLTTGEVAVITLEAGVEGHSVPSKTYFAMAAGAALLVIARGPSELTELVERHQCGLVVAPGDGQAAAAALRRFRSDPVFLTACRTNARAAMEAYFSRRNTEAYIAALRDIIP